MSLILENITKIYPNGVKAVDNLCLDIIDKDFVVLLGPSGSGKTTVLRMIAGLEEITDGKLLFDGVLYNKKKAAVRNFAMVFQSSALLPHLNAFDNIAFGLKFNKKIKLNKSQIKEKVLDAAVAVGISDLLDRKPCQMSGGQRQRVSLARVIATNPKLFLMDEPLSSIEPDLRTELKEIIKKIYKTLDTTFIYVTHDQSEAMTLATKIAIIDKGKLKQFDTASNIYNKPANMFVAGFVGFNKINFLTKNQCTLFFDKGKKIDGFSFDINSMHAGIRPEHIFLHKTKSANQISFDAKVNSIDVLGADAIVNAWVINKSQIFDTINFRVSCPHGLKLDDNIKLSFFVDNVHFFDKDQNRIFN